MAALHAQGSIGEPTFSIGDDFIDFGDPQSSAMEDYTQLEFFDCLDEELFWAVRSSGLAIGLDEQGEAKNQRNWGNVDLTELISNGEIYTVFDTSSPSVVIPSVFFNAYFKLLKEQIALENLDVSWATIAQSVTLEYGEVYAPCELNYPSLWFQIDGKWLEV
jgi:hypothetical protein